MNRPAAPEIPPHTHQDILHVLDEMRSEMRLEFAGVRSELREFRTETRQEIAALHKETEMIAGHLGTAITDLQFLKTRFGRLETELALTLPIIKGLAIEVAQIKHDVADVKADVASLRSTLNA